MLELPGIDHSVQEKSYDDVPYRAGAHPHTHPRHLYMVAKLFGLDPPDFRNCKVLEIGCALGGNLFPQAQQYPGSYFTGIDISSRQIAEAENTRTALGFSNISFVRADISNLGDKLGTFDYIIAHGVLSWVPPEVQERVFEICNAHLSENGVGLISYNALPGWNMVRSIREMAMFHANGLQDPADKVAGSKKLLNFLSNSLNETAPYKEIIDVERMRLERSGDYYVMHEYLEAENHQFYLHEFVHRASKHGLQYVGDTSLPIMHTGNLPPKVAKQLQEIEGDSVLQEQYMDFVTNRRFRDSIVTRANLEVDRNINPGKIYDFLVTANFEKDVQQSTEERTCLQRKQGGNSIFVENLEMAEVLIRLSKQGMRPGCLGKLIDDTFADEKTSARVRAKFRKSGMRLVLEGFLDLHADEGIFVDYLSDKPVANPVARHQASQPDCKFVTNCLGRQIRCDETTALILRSLDGTNDIDALARVLKSRVETDKAPVDQSLRNTLGQIAKKALLIA